MQEKGLYLKLGQFLNQYKSDVNYSEKVIIKKNDLDTNFQSIIANEVKNSGFEFIDDLFIMGSIGIVTRVRDKNGQIFALKIKYPKIEKNIKAQFKTLKNILAITPIPITKSNFDKDRFISVLKENITRELDYNQEYENTVKIKQMAKENNFIIVPDYLQPKSNSVLISSWIEGVNLGSNKKLPLSVREDVANKMLSFFHESLFNEGFIQVDNQEDNYIYSTTSKNLYMLDFGNCISISKTKRMAILRIIHSVQSGKDDNYLDLLTLVGFDKEKLKHIEEYLAPLLYAILAPYVCSIKYDLKNYNIGSIVDNILGEKKWWFRLSGSPEFFSLMRSFSLVLKTLKTLDVQIFFRGILKDVVNDELLFEAISLSIPKRDLGKYFELKAKDLNIRILRNDDEKINLTLPSTVLFELDSFLSKETLYKIEQAGGNIKDVIRKAFEKQLMPGTLLHLRNGNEQYIITLN